MNNGYTKIILACLSLSQVIATIFVHLSNLELYEVSRALESSGYMVVPNLQVRPDLTTFQSAFCGGLFFTFSLGAGLTIISMSAAWAWDRLAKRRRFLSAGAILLWGLSLILVNAQGFDELISAMLLLVCPLSWWLTVKSSPATSFSDPWPVRLIFMATLILVGGLWAFQIDDRVFLDLRDYTLWSNPAGRAISDFYYRHTLAPAEIFKSLKQKNIRTCSLPELKDANLTTRLKKAFETHDYLSLPRSLPVDLVLEAKDSDLLFFHRDQFVLKTSRQELFDDLKNVLDRYSNMTDRHRLFRRITYLSLIAGLPSTLFVFFFGCFQWIFRGVAEPRKGAIRAGILVLTLSLAILIPVWYGRSLSVEEPNTMLLSDSWWSRVAGLKTLAASSAEIHGRPYQPILVNGLPVEKYWLAVVLGHSRRPETYPALIKLLNEPDPNVVTMALRSLGMRRDPVIIPEIIKKIKLSDHWYVQWYGYRALKDLGWSQE
ncbi:MAG: HEAT repeat domain-containing protein [Deltaproteobacteria bacterium]|nr:HEAT repeat domain-containing protein [Deltaproteobacteria bacterium]